MPHSTNRGDSEVVLKHIAREGIFRMEKGNELTYANSAFLRMFGYESIKEYNSLRNRTIFSNPSDEALTRVVSPGNDIVDRRVLFKTRSQGSFWGLFSCTASGEQSYLGAVIDISNLVEHEHSLRLNANALAKSNMELDRFIYSASHDIRAPISTVMGLVNLINIEPDYSKQKTLVDMIGSTMNKLDAFLHQLSTYSKNARRDIDVSRINLNDLVNNSLIKINDHPCLQSVEINIDVQQDSEFFSDEERLQSIMYHLVKNSLDFSDATKTQRKIDIQARTVRGKLVIEVFDNGVGIPDNRVAHVFDIFYKASSLSSGSGLGLYLVRETVTRMDGVVTLHSRLGVGTVVRIEIPNSIHFNPQTTSK